MHSSSEAKLFSFPPHPPHKKALQPPSPLLPPHRTKSPLKSRRWRLLSHKDQLHIIKLTCKSLDRAEDDKLCLLILSLIDLFHSVTGTLPKICIISIIIQDFLFDINHLGGEVVVITPAPTPCKLLAWGTFRGAKPPKDKHNDYPSQGHNFIHSLIITWHGSPCTLHDPGEDYKGFLL